MLNFKSLQSEAFVLSADIHPTHPHTHIVTKWSQYLCHCTMFLVLIINNKVKYQPKVFTFNWFEVWNNVTVLELCQDRHLCHISFTNNTGNDKLLASDTFNTAIYSTLYDTSKHKTKQQIICSLRRTQLPGWYWRTTHIIQLVIFYSKYTDSLFSPEYPSRHYISPRKSYLQNTFHWSA